MNKYLKKLISVGSQPLSESRVSPEKVSELCIGSASELIEVLEQKNGFFAFVNALHVFPTGSGGDYSLEKWNDYQTWRYRYDDRTQGLLFFAEDIFGEQFALAEGAVKRFNPETGDISHFANTLEQWAQIILEKPAQETGYPLAHEWQRQNRALLATERLIPTIPFILGGEFKVDNLFAMDSEKSMLLRADIYEQIRNQKDGSMVKLSVVD